jgi:Arc/MetJ-type ribon-helix-helix transcriptional regulator
MAEEPLGIVSDSGMPRICIRLSRAQRDELEKLVDEGQFPSISEAIRFAVRKQVTEDSESAAKNRTCRKQLTKDSGSRDKNRTPH